MMNGSSKVESRYFTPTRDDRLAAVSFDYGLPLHCITQWTYRVLIVLMIDSFSSSLCYYDSVKLRPKWRRGVRFWRSRGFPTANACERNDSSGTEFTRLGVSQNKQ
jgi:hypothetical protein